MGEDDAHHRASAKGDIEKPGASLQMEWFLWPSTWATGWSTSTLAASFAKRHFKLLQNISRWFTMLDWAMAPFSTISLTRFGLKWSARCATSLRSATPVAILQTIASLTGHTAQDETKDIIVDASTLSVATAMDAVSIPDFFSTHISPDSTMNAPKELNTLNKCHNYTNDVYAISDDGSSDRQHDKSKKSVPTNLTPVTIMVVDTISSIESRKLLKVSLKVLFDSGSTTTLINS